MVQAAHTIALVLRGHGIPSFRCCGKRGAMEKVNTTRWNHRHADMEASVLVRLCEEVLGNDVRARFGVDTITAVNTGDGDTVSHVSITMFDGGLHTVAETLTTTQFLLLQCVCGVPVSPRSVDGSLLPQLWSAYGMWKRQRAEWRAQQVISLAALDVVRARLLKSEHTVSLLETHVESIDSVLCELRDIFQQGATESPVMTPTSARSAPTAKHKGDKDRH